MTNQAAAPDRSPRGAAPRTAVAADAADAAGRARRSGRFGAVAIVGSGSILVIVLLTIALPDPAAFLTMRIAIHTSLFLAAIVGVRTGLRAHGHDRAWRWLLAAALAISAVGGVAATVSGIEAGPHGAFPTMSTVHLVFLLPTVLGLAALLYYPADPPDPTSARLGGRWWTATILDSAIAVGSVALLAWLFVLRDMISTAHSNTESLAVPVVLITGNLMVVCAVLLIGIFRRPRSARGLGLLGAGLTAFSLSFLTYLYILIAPAPDLPHIAEVGFLLGGGCFLLSYLVPVEPRPGPVPAGTVLARLRGRWWRSLLPLLPLVVAGLASLLHLMIAGRLTPVETFGLITLLLLGLVRQMVVVGDNLDLLRRLERSEAGLHHQAFHDPLTGLANRTLFHDRLTTALAHQARNGQPLALLFCDLDDFKGVNDTLGHAAGDELLRVTAQRLTRAVRASDTVARFGGDEFAILLQASGEDPALTGRRVVTTVRAPVDLAGTRYAARVSVGLVVADATAALSAATLLHRADVAMYEAKTVGDGGLTIYGPRMAAAGTGAGPRATRARAARPDGPVPARPDGPVRTAQSWNAQSWSTAVTRTTAAPASSEAARSISALMPQS